MLRRGLNVLCAFSLMLCLVTAAVWACGFQRKVVARRQTGTVLRAWILDSSVFRFECLSEPTGKFFPLLVSDPASDTPLKVAKDYKISLTKGFVFGNAAAYV